MKFLSVKPIWARQRSARLAGGSFVVSRAANLLAFSDEWFLVSECGEVYLDYFVSTKNGRSSIFLKGRNSSGDLVLGLNEVVSGIDLDEEVFVLGGSVNYFHWVFDVIPRLAGLDSVGKSSPVLVDNSLSGIQREYLDELGVNQSRLIEIPYPEVVRIRKAVFCSWRIDSNMGLSEWSAESVMWVKKRLGVSYPKERKRIFLSRRSHPKGLSRLDNEEELFSFLERKGFERVETDFMPLRTQQELFASADFIVATHGAGLTNTVFCKKGTRLLEITNEVFELTGRPKHFFERTSAILGLKYQRYVCSQSFPADEKIDRPVRVSLRAFDRIYRHLCAL